MKAFLKTKEKMKKLLFLFFLGLLSLRLASL